MTNIVGYILIFVAGYNLATATDSGGITQGTALAAYILSACLLAASGYLLTRGHRWPA